MTKKQGKFILVAEDERSLAQALSLKLTKAGHKVIIAQDGEEALSQIAKNDFAVIILDLVMPKKDGFAVLEGIKKMKKNIFPIILTNLAQEEDRIRVMSLGAKAYFVKSNTPLADIIDFLAKI